MGCDIHAHIEYPYRAWDASRTEWRHFAGVFLPRNYQVFGHMAGVRTGATPVAEPRGFPEDADWTTRDAYCLHVRYDKSERDELQPTECLPAHAEKWLAGRSRTVVDKQSKDGDGRYHLISHPDWHTPSWLSAHEFLEALRRAGNVQKQYQATLAAMWPLLDEEIGEHARIVFWFDN